MLILKSFKIGFGGRTLNGTNLIIFILINDRVHYKGDTAKNINASKQRTG